MDGVSFRLDGWREGAIARRELVRAIVLAAVSGEGRVNVLLERAKRAARFETLPSRDQNVFNVMASQARAIVMDWADLDERTRQAFVSGRVPYSTVYTSLRGS